MKNATYIGNFKTLSNCNEIVSSIKNKRGHAKTAKKPYGKDVKLEKDLQSLVDKMFEDWGRAGYFDNNSVEWINFYPDKDFNRLLIEPLCRSLKFTPKNIWISSIKPGRCVPRHFDIETESQSWRKEGTLVRYSLFLDEPAIGHVFILKDECFHMCEQGDVYKWKVWDEYHIGVNVGFEQKYMMHLVGIESNEV